MEDRNKRIRALHQQRDEHMKVLTAVKKVAAVRIANGDPPDVQVQRESVNLLRAIEAVDAEITLLTGVKKQ